MYASDSGEPNLTIYDRQVRAFGKQLQAVLKRLTVGVVGAGGTGSSVVEQLVRLGVGSLVVADGQRLDASNVTRGYGSRLIDVGIPKAALAERLAFEIGLGTHVRPIERPVTFRSALEAFRECDVIFGSTDDQWGRSLLTRLSIYYYVPVLDMGVKIDSADGRVHSIQGRVTKLFPGSACLFCRNRISAAWVRAEAINAVSPREGERLREEGYAPELAEPAPAVIPFTTAVAATALAEFLHMLTGFMGNERRSTEIILRFDSGDVRTNSTAGNPDCLCGDREKWGRGDRLTFLDSTWRPE
jgi:molybdopterin/thiamine biosynthesis adenylyltransferase